MEGAAIAVVLQESVPDAALEVVSTCDLHATLYTSRDHLKLVARVLRDHADLKYSLLIDLTAVDYWPREPRFELVYLFVSIDHGARLRLKVKLDGQEAWVATVSDMWPAANWLEREVADLFGIVFDGHPDLRRLLMPEDWEGHPLRKDYPVQIRMTPRTTAPLQVTEKEFRANLERDRVARK
jgi:NADH-quinone oxidoreductase subunit C